MAGLGPWWDALAPHQRQAVYVGAAMLAIAWAVGALFLYAMVQADRKQTAKRKAEAEQAKPAAREGGGQQQRRAPARGRLQAGLRRRQQEAAAAAAAGEREAATEDHAASSGEEADAEDAAGPDRRAGDARRQAGRAERDALSARMRKREAYDEQRRRKDAEREAREAAEEEAAAAAEAERVAREDAEAAKWVGQISVEEQGEEAQTQEQAQGLLQAFIDYIVERKIVHLEELASEFGLKVQDAISRVQTLEEEGRITGVMDDRGKFIYILREEMAAVAGFIRDKGRVAIGELSAMSNTFIDLQQRETAQGGLADMDLDLGDLKELDEQPPTVSVGA